MARVNSNGDVNPGNRFGENVSSLELAEEVVPVHWADFLIGHDHHQCLGRHIGAVIIPEIVHQVLRLPGLETASPVDRGGSGSGAARRCACRAPRR